MLCTRVRVYTLYMHDQNSKLHQSTTSRFSSFRSKFCEIRFACKVIKIKKLLNTFFHCTYFQVTLFFHGNLYRGNRTTKINSGEFQAFDSPNLQPLATIEVKIDGKKVHSLLESLNYFFLMILDQFFKIRIYQMQNWTSDIISK